MKFQHTKEIIYSFLIALTAVVVFHFSAGSKILKYSTGIPVVVGVSAGQHNYFVDLDGDGVDEFIYTRPNISSFPSYVINDQFDGREQFNFMGEFIIRSELMFSDIDKDGFKEITIWILKNDSIMMNTMEYGKWEKPYTYQYVDKAPRYNGNLDLIISPGHELDMDNDGFNELYFSFKALFSVHPRYVFVYNVKENILYHSQDFGVQLNFRDTVDLNEDGIPEMIYVSWATANDEDTLSAINDHSAWVFIFEPDLSLFMPPFGEPGKSFGISVYIDNQAKNLIVLSDKFVDLSSDSSLLRINSRGEIIKTGTIPLSKVKGRYTLLKNCNQPYIRGPDMSLWKTYNDFTFKRVYSDKSIFRILTLQFESSIFDHWLTIDHSFKSIKILNGNFKPVFSIKVNEVTSGLINVSRGLGGQMLLNIHTKSYLRTIPILLNPWFRWKHALQITLFFTSFFFSFIAFRYYNLWIESKQRKLVDWQLKALRSQFDSHFLFNALNAINNEVLKGDKLMVYDYLTKFSSLLRYLLDYSETSLTALDNELKFIRDYLDIQKLRFRDKITYLLAVEDKVDSTILIPKMAIHTFVENAVKHGISPKNEGGIINVRVMTISNGLRIEVEDNGDGRKTHNNQSNQTGLGLKLLDNYFELYNKLHSSKLSYFFIDKTTGTVAVIELKF